MDIEISDYYKYLYSTINELPASNNDISLDKYGNKYNTKNIEGIMKQNYILKEKMQYKFFINPIK